MEYRSDLFCVLSANTAGEFKKHCYDRGIGRPSIFDGILQILPLPTCFTGDLMHQPLINLTNLLLDLWCARPKARNFDHRSIWPWAVLVGEVWIRHGKAVADTARYLPTSFGRPPRNPQKKISSNYKAWELLNYIYGVGPGVFYGVLPEPYYSHYC